MTLLQTVILTAASLMLGCGLFLVAAELLRLPTRRTSAAFVRGIRREERRGREGAVDTALSRLSAAIARWLRLSEAKKADLSRTLAAANMKITPEQHVADCIVKAGVLALFALPALPILPVLSPVILACSVGVFIGEYSSPERKIAEIREEIEYELPMFVGRIESMLRHTRDVVAVLNSYRENAGPALRRELTVTVADMQSGNMQEALARFETRVGITAVSDIARGLSAVIEGNDPVGYWAALQARLTDSRRQVLLRKARAIPGKISRLSFCLLGCTVILYLTVICSELFRSLGVLLA